ncbi:MAG: hypothetical protein ACLPHP_05480 [Candidatus Sulfotelmatobacter sp.]
MTVRHRRLLAILSLLFTSLIRCGVAQAAAGVTVPAGTQLNTLKYNDTAGTVVQLKPAEQVAFLFVYGMQNLESNCLSTFFGGPGRLCSLDELVKGLHGKSGIIGLNTDPAQDSNYQYKLEIIGQDCVIRAIPQHAGLGGFTYIGSPSGMHGNFYYNPIGADMTQAKVLGEMGYSGKGFTR